jgi:hypothetical protein
MVSSLWMGLQMLPTMALAVIAVLALTDGVGCGGQVQESSAPPPATCDIILRCEPTDSLNYRLCPDRIGNTNCGGRYAAFLACRYAQCPSVSGYSLDDDGGVTVGPCCTEEMYWRACTSRDPVTVLLALCGDQ